MISMHSATAVKATSVPALARATSASSGKKPAIALTMAAVKIAAFFPLDEIVALANAGTLIAFSAVASCMLIMRRRAPDAPRGFRMPAAWVLGPVAILGCLYLFFSLPQQTQVWFLIWNVVGIAVYALYGARARAAALARAGEEAAAL